MSVASPNTPACAVPGTPLAGVRAGIDACVHCGFCLQACPTYLALGDENDSPRGRILLMRLVYEGSLAVDDAAVRTHIDRCLGCRGCETACPSGVPYGQLLEAMRATLNQRSALPWTARTILGVFERPVLLRVTMALARAVRATRLPALLARIPGRPGFALAMLDATRPVLPEPDYTLNAPDAPEARYAPHTHNASSTPDAPVAHGRGPQVALLAGCVMHGLYRHTNSATGRVLQVNGYRVVDAPGQGCCGALHAHAGDLEGARRLARRNIAAFEQSGAEVITVNSAGCGAMCKEYGHLLDGDAEWAARAAAFAERVRDVSELLAAAGPVEASAPATERDAPLRVAYDAPCHLQHAQRVVDAPMRVLGAARGVELVPLTDADQCCGSAGIFTLIQPEVSTAVLTPKIRHIAAARVDLVATGNPGCLMQIGAGLRRAGLRTRAVHPVDLLDAAYRGGKPAR
ncbi:MAG TPA: heterodisulfide reductase-related iron-sulfur binding cluster [Gemmatimonadaceae bacterium]|nr:heterodisulfide reductase-related iron-sulfur binding cluster [Gemmatimonadaceae bacterium]